MSSETFAERTSLFYIYSKKKIYCEKLSVDHNGERAERSTNTQSSMARTLMLCMIVVCLETYK